MKKTFLTALSLLLLMGTGTVVNAANKPEDPETSKPASTTQNENFAKADLSKLKKNKKGAYILFDGSSLYGWRGYNKATVPSKWTIDEGALKFAGKTAAANQKEGGDIIFAHDFKNFELELETKISHAGNSGIFVLAKEISGKPIYISAPEYQVLDNDNHPDAKMGVNGNRKSASLYDMIPATPQNANPAGQWNKVKIVVKDGVISNYQNGVKVVEYKFGTPEWTALLQQSKFSEAKWPDAFKLLNNLGGESKSGVIGFQDHGDDVWFRNVTLKVLK